MNYPSDKGKEHDIECTSRIFPEKTIYPDNNTNYQKYPSNKEKEIKNNNEIYEIFPNNNEIVIIESFGVYIVCGMN